MTLINIQKKLEGGFSITDKLIKQLSFLLLLSIHFISENAMSASEEFSLDNQIYKVLTLEEWERAQASGIIITDLDKKDGFIHLSTATQLNATLSLYFSKEESVVLLQIDHVQTHDQLRFEAPIPPGNRINSFPHYYGDLNTNFVSKIWHLSRGAFEIPIEVMLEAEQGANS
tara:strand:+ start:1438 stop:1953 length:516 start_codon:yes stop_codon:yes gene_type:complete